MAQKKVVIYTCDICLGEGSPESHNWKQPLPQGWVDMNVVSNDGVLISKHLCPLCFAPVVKALIAREAKVAKT